MAVAVGTLAVGLAGLAGLWAGPAQASTAAARSGRLQVSIGPPPEWLPVGGRPTTLTVSAARPSRLPSAAINAYVALQSVSRRCQASARADRARPLHEIRGMYALAHLASSGDFSASVPGVVVRQRGAVRVCGWLARSTGARGLAADEVVPLLNGLFAASVSALPWARGAHTYTFDAISVTSGLRYSGVTSHCGASYADPSGTVGADELASETVALGSDPCAGDGSSFSLGGGGVPASTLAFGSAQASAVPLQVEALGGCELDPLTAASLAAARAYVAADGCRVGAVLVAPFEPGTRRGAVLEAEIDGGVAEVAPADTTLDLVLNGR